MMKRVAHFLFTAGLCWGVFPAVASAQLQLGDRLLWCYMIDADNQVWDLSLMCGQNTPVAPRIMPRSETNVSVQPSNDSTEFSASDLAAYYAQQYCIAREMGFINADAEKFAREQLANSMVVLEIDLSILTIDLIQEAQKNKKILCSNLTP